MLPSQERIVKLCKERNISASQLEREINVSNGYIKAARTREFPIDRLTAIANALDTTVDYLIYGEDNYLKKKNRDFLASQLESLDAELGTKGRKIVTMADFKAAFCGNEPDLTEADIETLWNDVVNFVEFRKHQLRAKRAVAE